jgi:hypothetical protein
MNRNLHLLDRDPFSVNDRHKTAAIIHNLFRVFNSLFKCQVRNVHTFITSPNEYTESKEGHEQLSELRTLVDCDTDRQSQWYISLNLGDAQFSAVQSLVDYDLRQRKS